MEKKTFRQLYEDYCETANSQTLDKEWVSKESLLKLIKENNLSYITKERLLKELD